MSEEKVRKIIEDIISSIGKCRREIESKGNARAKAIAMYDLRFGDAVETLKTEGKFPVTIIRDLAKKLCHKDREDLEIAEMEYKACVTNLQALMAQLNGYQSIYRYSESV